MKMTVRAVRVALPLFASAAIALTGCVGTASDPAGTTAPEPRFGASSTAASERAPGALEARSVEERPSAVAGNQPTAQSHQVPQEVEAPASTKLHESISTTEAEALLSSIDRPPRPEAKADTATKADIVHFCPACLLTPDLTVVEDDRGQWLWDPSAGWYQGYARGFDVQNLGAGDAGTFHVAVLQGSDSYGFDVPGLAAGASEYFQIRTPSYLGPACGVSAVIIVNPFNAIAETNYNNNVATVAGICLL